MEKGHYGQYSGNARHSHKHHMVNSWEEEDVKRGRKEMAEGHKGHAEALFDDAHGSYNWDGHNSTGAEHHGMSRKSKRADRIRKRALKRSERSGAERGDEYDYEDPRVMEMLRKANKLDERSNSRMLNKMGSAAGNIMNDYKKFQENMGGGPNRMTGHGQSKGDQSATHTDYAHYKGTDKGYHGHTGASHGDQSATHRDYMVDPRTHNSPLHNTGWSGFNYNKAAAELDYMPIEHDMHRGMSRESSELKDMPILDIEKGDAEGDKYKKVINKAMMQKATKAEVSAKLREMFPEVKNNSVEVNWSPDGKKVEVHKKDKGMSRKKSKKELEKERDFVEERIRKQNADAKDPNASPRQTKRLERINKQIKEFDQRKSISRMESPLNAKGDKCPESGCVQEKGNGKWGVISGKTGKWWDANYDSRSSAEAGLRAYFANGGN